MHAGEQTESPSGAKRRARSFDFAQGKNGTRPSNPQALGNASAIVLASSIIYDHSASPSRYGAGVATCSQASPCLASLGSGRRTGVRDSDPGLLGKIRRSDGPASYELRL